MKRLFRRMRRRIKRASDAVVGALAIGVLKTVRMVDPDKMSDFGGSMMRRIGPLLPESRIGRANLVAAFPEKSEADIEAILRGCWDNLGRMGAEFAHLDRLWSYDREDPTRGRIELAQPDIERFHKLLDDGKPALIFAAHLANWELPALAAVAHGLDSAVLYRRPNIGAVDRAIRDMRSLKMTTLIPSGRGASVHIAGVLARGGHVGLLVDQQYRRGTDVTFFGRATRANPLIARLARNIECPIHGVRVMRLPDHRFRIELTEALDPPRDAEGKIDVAATMQAITAIVERWIRERPHEWLWVHQRWRGRP